MPLDTQSRAHPFPSIGIDAVSFERYSDFVTDEVDIIIHDEQCEDAWIRSDMWLPVTTIA